MPLLPDEPLLPELPDEPAVPELPELPDEPDVPLEPAEPDVPDEPELPDVPSSPDVPLLPAVPLLPDEPDEPDVPDEPPEPSVPDVPEEPTAAATFLLSNLFVTLFQITTSSDEPVGKLFICIAPFPIILPLTPILPLIVSDAFIVWSLLICKNDAVSVFAAFNANRATLAVYANEAVPTNIDAVCEFNTKLAVSTLDAFCANNA